MMVSRSIHFSAAVAVLVLATASRILVPELWADRVLSFAGVGGFLTFYGVIFAVIETSRARKAATLAEQAALQASDRVSSLYNLKSITECQSCISFALKDIDKEGWASTSALARIVELYTAEFHEEYADSQSPQRMAIVALQSHASNALGPLGVRAAGRLKATLLGMLSDLTAIAGTQLSEYESQ